MSRPHQSAEFQASVFEEPKIASPLHPNRIKDRVYGFASLHKYEGRIPFIEERKFVSQNNVLLSLSLSYILLKTRASSLISLDGVSINESKSRLPEPRPYFE